MGKGSSCDFDDDYFKDHDYADAGKDDDNLLMITMTMLLLMSSEPPHKPVRPSQKANSPCPRIPSACAGKINISWKYHHAEEENLPKICLSGTSNV